MSGDHETILNLRIDVVQPLLGGLSILIRAIFYDRSSIVAAVRLLTATLYPVNIRPLLRFGFAVVDGFLGHVAGIVMILPRLLFARSLLVWILVVGHRILL